MNAATPPKIKTDGQSKRVTRKMLGIPPSAAPRGKPLATAARISARRRDGENSAAQAIMLGGAPPSPKPVTKRSASNIHQSVAQAVAIVNAPKIATLIIMVLRRPKRSESEPSTNWPSMIPAKGVSRIGTNLAGVRCQEAAPLGTTNTENL